MLGISCSPCDFLCVFLAFIIIIIFLKLFYFILFFTLQYCIGFANGNDNPVGETAKDTQMYRTVFWTLWERVRVG